MSHDEAKDTRKTGVGTWLMWIVGVLCVSFYAIMAFGSHVEREERKDCEQNYLRKGYNNADSCVAMERVKASCEKQFGSHDVIAVEQCQITTATRIIMDNQKKRLDAAYDAAR